MRILSIDADTGTFNQYAPDNNWLRIEICGKWYDLQHSPEGGLQVSTENRMEIHPRYSNTIWIGAT